MLRFFFNLFRFSQAAEKRDVLRRDLKTYAAAQRELANSKSGPNDYWLKRDLERTNQTGNSDRK